MAIFEEVQSLLSAGRQRAAAAALYTAADAGDAEAMYGLANWRLFGLHGPRDFAEVHTLLKAAADAGHVMAVGLRATLIGNGTGCASDVDLAAEILATIRDADPGAAKQLDLCRKMPSAEEVARLPQERISDTPFVRCIRNFLSEEECRYIAACAAPELRPSLVIDPQTGRMIPDPIRTSSGMSFGPTQEDQVIHRINRRIASVTGTQVGSGEPLHVLHYEPGQQYRAHVDTLRGAVNQRHWTVLLYLSAGYTGGETQFDLADLTLAGQQGDALIFRNVDGEGRPDPVSRHAGLPVTEGTKWLATRWIRETDHDPWELPELHYQMGSRV